MGSAASLPLTVDKRDPAWQYVAAIPAAAPDSKRMPRPRPAEAQKPDDPKLGGAFRRILRRETPRQEVDALVAECREIVKGTAKRTARLRGAAILGCWLIEEAEAGRLKAPYGSPHARKRLEELLQEIRGE